MFQSRIQILKLISAATANVTAQIGKIWQRRPLGRLIYNKIITCDGNNRKFLFIEQEIESFKIELNKRNNVESNVIHPHQLTPRISLEK